MFQTNIFREHQNTILFITFFSQIMPLMK